MMQRRFLCAVALMALLAACSAQAPAHKTKLAPKPEPTAQDLFEYVISDKPSISDHLREVKRIFRQCVEAVHHMHKRGLVHRDIKLENFLIHSDAIKLGDFGLSLKPSSPTKLSFDLRCGSDHYLSPELIMCDDYYNPVKADIWALGVVLYSLVYGHFPFQHANRRTLMTKIVMNEYELLTGPAHEHYAELNSLISGLLSDEKNRLGLDQVLELI